VIQALEQTGQRAVLCAGEGGIADPERPELVYYTRFVPFEWLFPRVRAVVHHGATGTTSLGLKYGKPTVICPLIGDQEFWGKILYRRGLAPAPFARRYVDLTAERLAAAIRTVVDDPGMRVRAEALAQQLQREDGVSNAVDFVEQQVACWTVTG
jgi:sterol 3beta-glucosyltransferase